MANQFLCTSKSVERLKYIEEIYGFFLMGPAKIELYLTVQT